MPLTPAITVAQSALDPAAVLLTDTSTGSDGSVTQRRVFFQTAFGTYLVEDGVLTSYNEWSYADASKSFSVLDKDYGLAITVQWLDAGNNVLYTYTNLYPLSYFNKNFMYSLVQNQALSPGSLADRGYSANMAKYWMNIIGGINAVEVGADIAAAQDCFDRATEMMEQQSKYF